MAPECGPSSYPSLSAVADPSLDRSGVQVSRRQKKVGHRPGHRHGVLSPQPGRSLRSAAAALSGRNERAISKDRRAKRLLQGHVRKDPKADIQTRRSATAGQVRGDISFEDYFRVKRLFEVSGPCSSRFLPTPSITAAAMLPLRSRPFSSSVNHLTLS
jgi:hypothetical protein